MYIVLRDLYGLIQEVQEVQEDQRSKERIMNGTPSFADPANLEPKRDEAIEVAPDGTSLDLLRAIYRRADLPLSTRIRAATAALPHEHPKLAVTAMVTSGDFAIQLDRAIREKSASRNQADD